MWSSSRNTRTGASTTPKARPTSRWSVWRRWSGRSASFKVVDAKSGEDITRSVLTQIIMDEEARGSTMLPVNFLRQLISMYGDSDAVDGAAISRSLARALQRNQSQFREAMAGALRGQSLRRDGAAQHGDVHRRRGRRAARRGREAPAEAAQAAPGTSDNKAELAGAEGPAGRAAEASSIRARRA